MGKMSKAEKIEMEKRALAENRQMMADMMRKTPLEEAAPELLEACKAALDSIKKDDAYHIWLNYPNTPELTLGKMLESAIAKAEGKP